MSSADELALFDSNIWIYSFDIGNFEKYTAAKDLREKAIEGLLQVAITPQNFTEAFRALTDSKLFTSALSPTVAGNQLRHIWKTTIKIYPNQETMEILLQLIKSHPRKSKSLGIYDTFLVATMLSHGIETLYTDNEKDFRHFTELKIVNPFGK